MVQVHSGLPNLRSKFEEVANDGAIAQLGERLPCTQEVCGSIPHSSTIFTAKTQENFRVYLKRFTAKFCSLKIWIKLKIETTHCLSVFESLKFSQSEDIFGL